MLDKPKRDPALIRKIKNWAYENLPITKEATVSVMELQCHEQDCSNGARIGNPSVQIP